MDIKTLNQELGNADLYLLDHILKDRFNQDMRILDAGCGEGRNLIWFLNNQFNVYGIDANPDAIALVKFIVQQSYPNYPHENFLASTIEKSPFPDEFFDAIICSAVLHFAEDRAHFMEMFGSLIRQLKPNGLLFIRSCTDWGITGQHEIKPNIFELSSGLMRFVIDDTLIREMEKDLEWLEPVKSVVVNKSSSMGVFLGKKIAKTI